MGGYNERDSNKKKENSKNREKTMKAAGEDIIMSEKMEKI